MLRPHASPSSLPSPPYFDPLLFPLSLPSLLRRTVARSDVLYPIIHIQRLRARGGSRRHYSPTTINLHTQGSQPSTDQSERDPVGVGIGSGCSRWLSGESGADKIGDDEPRRNTIYFGVPSSQPCWCWIRPRRSRECDCDCDCDCRRLCMSRLASRRVAPPSIGALTSVGWRGESVDATQAGVGDVQKFGIGLIQYGVRASA